MNNFHAKISNSEFSETTVIFPNYSMYVLYVLYIHMYVCMPIRNLCDWI